MTVISAADIDAAAARVRAAIVRTPLLDVSRQTVNAIETGKYAPSLPLAFRIAALFDRPIEAIFEP